MIIVFISGALTDIARGGDLVACEPQRVTGDSSHWAYRIVDGRECWYPGRPGKSKNELFWDRGVAPSARRWDPPEAETGPSEPPSNFMGAPPEQPKTPEATPEQWHGTAADQLLAFTCCWPELEEPALVPQSPLEPPAWPLALLPLGFYALWWIARPRRALQARRMAAPRATRLPSNNGRDGGPREPRLFEKRTSKRQPRQRTTGVLPPIQHRARLQHHELLFVLPRKEEQQVSLASLVDAPDPVARPSVGSSLRGRMRADSAHR